MCQNPYIVGEFRFWQWVLFETRKVLVHILRNNPQLLLGLDLIRNGGDYGISECSVVISRCSQVKP